MAAIDTFQTAATTFLAAAATYATDETAVPAVTVGDITFRFSDDALATAWAEVEDAPLEAAKNAFVGAVEEFAADNPSSDFHQLTDYDLRIGGGTLIELKHD